MPIDLNPEEFLPVESRRKRYISHGGLGNDLNGPQSHHNIQQYKCCNCKKVFQWSAQMEGTDYGDVVDNICLDCRKILRSMRTNHPEMK